jgi:hypothetical protein
MKRIVDRIRNSEFLTFSEVLRLKVTIVTLFIVVLSVLSILFSSFNTFTDGINIILPIIFGVLILITMLLTVVNLNRFAMHFSIITMILITWYLASGTNHFYGYMMFFVTLTIIIFYQDISTYILYGLVTTAYGVYYVFDKGSLIIGTNAIDADVSLYSYLIILIGFYVVFLIQFLVSDNIYEKMNNEWVRMNKILSRYQELTFKHLLEMIEENDQEPIYRNVKFQQAVNEISIFINEFFEENADNIAEVVEFYFFLHDHEVDKIIESSDLPIITRKYAAQLSKYLLNQPSELVSILFGFSTLFREKEEYQENRYEYNLDKLFHDRIDKLLSLAMLYRFLKTEVTQLDKWGNVKRVLTHKEITEMFISKEFREFITYEQVNFYLDNEDLFEEYL